MPKNEKRVITPEQYTAIVAPVTVTLPSSLELFAFQREKLADFGLANMGDFDKFSNRLPKSGLFLLVPPQPKVLDTSALMQLVNPPGFSLLDGALIKDTISVPKTATILIDIEDGRGRMDTNLVDQSRSIECEGRMPFTVWVGIIHVILFPEVLLDHSMHLAGSDCPFKGFGPGLCRVNGTPTLNSYGNSGEGQGWGWGTPSYGKVKI